MRHLEGRITSRKTNIPNLVWVWAPPPEKDTRYLGNVNYYKIIRKVVRFWYNLRHFVWRLATDLNMGLRKGVHLLSRLHRTQLMHSFREYSSKAEPERTSLLKQLRERSGAPITEVKAALAEAGWDLGMHILPYTVE